MKNLSPVIILGDSSTNSLGVIRAFGRRQIPVILLSKSKSNSTLVRSRYVSEFFSLNDWSTAEIEATLKKVVRHRSGDEPLVVFPTSDAALLAYSRLKSTLDGPFTDSLPPGNLVEICIHKDKFYELARRFDWVIPKSIYLPLEQFKENGLREKFGYPFALKPVESHRFVSCFDQKLFVIQSHQDLIHRLQELAKAEIPVLAQELISGSEFFMMYFYISKNQQSIAVSGFRKVRQSPPDYGTGSLVESFWNEELIRRSITHLKEMGYTGIGEIEYKLDERSDEYKLLEVNARSNTFNRLPAKMGIDFEYLYYLDALNRLEDGLFMKPSREKMRWIDFTKDIPSLNLLRKNGAISFSEVIDSFRYLKLDGYFAWDDLSPFFAELGKLLSGIVHYLKKKRGQKAPPAL